MNVTNEHWLDGAQKISYPGGPLMPIRRFAVAHFTSGATAKSSIGFWGTTEARGAEAHVIIDRDGTIYQIRPFNQKCDHAGVSRWQDKNREYLNLNSCSIGVEFANAGDGANEDGTAFTTHKFQCPAGVQLAKHKNGGPMTYWEQFPDAQIKAGIEVFKALVSRYNLDDVVGHEDIAPARKNDPGPLFPMLKIRESCGFTGLPKKS